MERVCSFTFLLPQPYPMEVVGKLFLPSYSHACNLFLIILFTQIPLISLLQNKSATMRLTSVLCFDVSFTKQVCHDSCERADTSQENGLPSVNAASCRRFAFRHFLKWRLCDCCTETTEEKRERDRHGRATLIVPRGGRGRKGGGRLGTIKPLEAL